MDFRKNIYWIALIVIVLLGIGAWAVFVPSIEAQTAELKDSCNSKADEFSTTAALVGKEDRIKNAKHAELAKKFSQKLSDQLGAVRKDLENMKLDLRFDDAPQPSGQFDIWLSEKRQKIMKQAADAGLQLPPDADRLMFREPATDDNSRRVELHRSYRLRQMAIVEEVVDILSKKYGKQDVLRFEPDKEKLEPQEKSDAGALALERLSITWPASVLQVAAAETRGPEGKKTAAAASSTTSEGRAKTVLEEALRRSGRAMASAKTAVEAEPYAELPYDVTTLDVQFVAPLAVVPAIAKALESSGRWAEVITRLEYERGAPSYPSATEPKLAKAGPVPSLNTHYQEGPVRALVSLDLYEYSDAKVKAEEARAKAAAAAAAAAAARLASKKDAKK